MRDGKGFTEQVPFELDNKRFKKRFDRSGRTLSERNHCESTPVKISTSFPLCVYMVAGPAHNHFKYLDNLVRYGRSNCHLSLSGL